MLPGPGRDRRRQQYRIDGDAIAVRRLRHGYAPAQQGVRRCPGMGGEIDSRIR
jgi:hypothetical protein